MTLSFYKFSLQLNEGIDYSIPHIEDLDVETFIRVVDRIDEFDAVQKLDGANLRAGIDQNGNFFVSREQKGGKRFYKQGDFPNTSSYDGFRAAFEVLKKHEDIIKDVVSPGEAMNLEVIYGSQPNTVFYGKDGLNYLAVLEMVLGDDPSLDPDQDKVKELVKKLSSVGVIHVETMAYDTTDGKTLTKAPKITDWKITKSDPVDGYKDLSFSKEITSLKKYLKEPNKFAHKNGKDLSNFEVLKDRSRDLAEERKMIDEKILNDYKLPIKQALLQLVKKQKPSLRGEVDDGAYHGIEGIIFADPKTREKFKIVDREVFTRINQFNYQVRKGISSRTLTTDVNQSKESRGGIVGEARIRSINMFGLKNANVPNQTKKILANFKGSTRAETLDNINDTLHQLNFQAVKRKIQSIYVSSLSDLEEALDSFKIHGDDYTMKLDDGVEIKYTKEIKRRTLMYFAEANKGLLQTLLKIRRTQNMKDLIEVFFSNQLDELHGGTSQ